MSSNWNNLNTDTLRLRSIFNLRNLTPIALAIVLASSRGAEANTANLVNPQTINVQGNSAYLLYGLIGQDGLALWSNPGEARFCATGDLNEKNGNIVPADKIVSFPLKSGENCVDQLKGSTAIVDIGTEANPKYEELIIRADGSIINGWKGGTNLLGFIGTNGNEILTVTPARRVGEANPDNSVFITNLDTNTATPILLSEALRPVGQFLGAGLNRRLDDGSVILNVNTYDNQSRDTRTTLVHVSPSGTVLSSLELSEGHGKMRMMTTNTSNENSIAFYVTTTATTPIETGRESLLIFHSAGFGTDGRLQQRVLGTLLDGGRGYASSALIQSGSDLLMVWNTPDNKKGVLTLTKLNLGDSTRIDDEISIEGMEDHQLRPERIIIGDDGKEYLIFVAIDPSGNSSQHVMPLTTEENTNNVYLPIVRK